MRTILLGAFAVLLVPSVLAGEQQSPHWGYQGEHGPAQWAQLEPGFSTCALGQLQSPIDIRNAVKADLPEIDFAYRAGPAEVLNNGHTVQVNLPAAGGIAIAGANYALLQFHFHTPSEERIAGMAWPMVAHLVHKSAQGQLAVVAVLFKEGAVNAALAPVFANLPAAGKSQALADRFDPSQILPDKRGYYAYQGSLTTPPCSEQVRWQVLKQPLELSAEQMAAFRQLYPMNARPVQPLNGRDVLESR